jgi:hypothetical protein
MTTQTFTELYKTSDETARRKILRFFGDLTGDAASKEIGRTAAFLLPVLTQRKGGRKVAVGCFLSFSINYPL